MKQSKKAAAWEPREGVQISRVEKRCRAVHRLCQGYAASVQASRPALPHRETSAALQPRCQALRPQHHIICRNAGGT
jgi:hypothetical protein